MLEMSSMYLPINKNWLRYIDNCERSYQDIQHIAKNSLIKSANEACEFIHDQKLVIVVFQFHLFTIYFLLVSKKNHSFKKN